MPEDYRNIYNRVNNIANKADREIMQYRTICDFVASMTDKYAVEFYGRLQSETPQSIFKSI
jgi:dGTPase